MYFMVQSTIYTILAQQTKHKLYFLIEVGKKCMIPDDSARFMPDDTVKLR